MNYKNYKSNINLKIFYLYLVIIFLFIIIFSINFLILQFIEKQNVIYEILKSYELNNGNLSENERLALIDKSQTIFKLWSFPTYFGGIVTILIFFVFVLFGKTKIEYGYFFRTVWIVIFLSACVFMFFTIMPLWQQIVNFLLILTLAIVTIIDLLKLNRKRENLKLEIKQEWNNKNNRNVRSE